MTRLETALYDEPAWYDLLHAEGTAEEAGLLVDIHRLHGNGGKDWLEPACGTGRLLERLSAKGFRVTGYDINAKALAFARKRLRDVELLRADMTSFCRPDSFDVAFNLLGSFRHLATDKAALAHLRSTARSLRKGGIYIIQLDMADYAHPEDDEETWTERSGRRRVDHVMICLAPDRRGRREKLIQFFNLRGNGRRRLLRCEYDLRSYDLAQWKALIAKTPFKIARAMLNPPKRPGVRDGVFVLVRH